MAGARGIEPMLTVLETVVLPLYDAPRAFSNSGNLSNSLLPDKVSLRKMKNPPSHVCLNDGLGGWSVESEDLIVIRDFDFACETA